MSEAAKEKTNSGVDVFQEELKGDRGVLVLKQTLGSDFLQALFQFFKLAEIHDAGNEVFVKAISDVRQAIQVWIQIPEFGKLLFKLSGDQIFINEVRIRPKPRFIEKLQYLLRFMRKRRLTGFTIDTLPTTEHLSLFVWGLSRASRGDTAQLENDLKDQGVVEFKLGTLAWKKDAEGAELVSLATDLYSQFYSFAKTCFDDFDKATQMTPPNLDGMFDALQNIDEADLMSLFCGSSIKKIERPLATIAVNSAFMLYAWAKSLGLPSGVFLELAGAGLAHPLVLINAAKGMPTDIRRFERSSLAFSNLQRIKNIWPLTELQTLALLEWSVPYGTNGVYEVGGQRCYQHFFSRMLRIAVLFQQMLCLEADRSPERAVGRLLTSEMGCDQTLVKLFVNWLGIYPVGAFVTLTSGETGQVCSTASDLMSSRRPSVSVYKDKDGNILTAPKIVDLNDLDGDSYAVGIKSSLLVKEVGIPTDQLQLLSSMMSISMTN